MRIVRFVFLPLLSAASVSAHTQIDGSPIFTHDALTCVSTEDFPIVEAKFEPAQLRVLRRAQVYFKASSGEAWYFVEMEPGEGSRLQATLPRPLAETERVDYYLFFLSSGFEPAQSEEFSAYVSEAGCGAIRRAASGSPVSLTLRATVANQPPVPPGFSPQGISRLVTASGNTVAVGSATAGGGAGGGGLPGLMIGAVAGGGAAGAAGVVMTGGSGTDGDSAAPPGSGETPEGGSSSTSPVPSPAPTPTESPDPTPGASVPDVSGTWDVTDRVTESCFPGHVGQTSNTTMVIQQDDTRLTVSLSDVDFTANLTGTIDSAGNISMSGQFNDEGDTGEVRVEASTTTGSEMRGNYTQFYPEHQCTVRGTFSGTKH